MKSAFTLMLLLLLALTASPQNPQTADLNGNRPRTATTQFFPAPQAPDAGNDWISIGPNGGDVIDLAANPEQPLTVFAAAGQPFVSTDGGAAWSVLENLSLLASGAVNAIESASNGVLIATGTYTNGKVFRSLDGGVTWQGRVIPVNVPGLCVAMDPNDTNTMYVGLTSNISSLQNKVIVKSVNGGTNWTAIDMTSVLPVGYGVISICVDPSNSQAIFAIGLQGFGECLLVASFDGGTTWEDRTNNLPTGVPYNCVAIGGGNVYVAGGQLFGSQYMGVYKSTDNGLTWNNISGSFPNQVSNYIAIDPADANTLFVGTEGDGIYSSTDGGTTWNYTTSGAGENGAARTLLFMPGSSDVLYAGYLSIAVCKTTDGGATWDYANTGIATLLVNDVEIDPADPARVLVGFEAQNSGGCFLSLDTGATWSLVAGLPGTRYSKVGVTASGALVAWSNGPSTIAQEGLYKSYDGGVTWTNLGPNIGDLFETEIYALATSETDSGLIFIGGNNFGVNGWASVIWRTRDGGQTWDNVYVGSLPDNFESFRYLFIDPNSGDQIIYASMKSEVNGSILKSVDGGDTWGVTSSNIPGTEKWFGAIVCDPDNSQKIFAGAGGYGTNTRLWISADAGVNWTQSGLLLGAYSKVQDLCVNPDNSDVIYAATGQDGVYLTTDGGASWAANNSGMPAVNISAFSHPWQSGDHWDLLASTTTNSVFKTTVFTPGVGIPDNGNQGNLNVYPNPSNGNLTISLGSLPVKEARAEIYNSAGMLIRVYDLSTPSLHLELSAGIYLCRVISGGVTETARIVVRP